MLDGEVRARLDARGLVCPQPLLKARKILDTLKPGDRLEVLADDPVSPLDFAAFCHRSGNPLRESTKDASGHSFRFVIEHK